MTTDSSTTCPDCDGTGDYGPDRDDDLCEMCQATGTLYTREPGMDLFNMAFDDMNAIDVDEKNLTVDQRLKIVEVKALLSISQELSRIHHERINPGYSRE